MVTSRAWCLPLLEEIWLKSCNHGKFMIVNTTSGTGFMRRIFVESGSYMVVSPEAN